MSWSKTPSISATCVRSATGALWLTSIGLRVGWQPQLRWPAGRAIAGGMYEIGRRIGHIFPAIVMCLYCKSSGFLVAARAVNNSRVMQFTAVLKAPFSAGVAIFPSREIDAFNSKSYTILVAGGFIPIIISRRKRLHLQQDLFCLQ